VDIRLAIYDSAWNELNLYYYLACISKTRQCIIWRLVYMARCSPGWKNSVGRSQSVDGWLAPTMQLATIDRATVRSVASVIGEHVTPQDHKKEILHDLVGLDVPRAVRCPGYCWHTVCGPDFTVIRAYLWYCVTFTPGYIAERACRAVGLRFDGMRRRLHNCVDLGQSVI
jgi:hypothetical protein